MKVDASVYSGVSGAERRRIAKELAQVRERRALAEAEAWRIRQANPDPNWEPWLRPTPSIPLMLAKQLEVAVELPTRLLPCGFFPRPPDKCTCLDSAGKPPEWWRWPSAHQEFIAW